MRDPSAGLGMTKGGERDLVAWMTWRGYLLFGLLSGVLAGLSCWRALAVHPGAVTLAEFSPAALGKWGYAGVLLAANLIATMIYLVVKEGT